MAVVRIRRAATGPDERFDAMNAKAGTAENPPKGLIVSTIGQFEGQWQAVDVWESAEDADRFERELEPHARQVHGESFSGFPEHTTYEVQKIFRP
jgi:hypothetical protein